MSSRSPSPFTLRQLQYAVAVADTLSFRRAALECHVSQPSLSAQIAELEGGLSVRLFERDRRRVLVTAAGRELVARARRVLLEAQDLGESARRASDPLTGTLRLGVIPTIAPYVLPELTPRLRAKFERLALMWIEDKTEALAESLERGELDAVLVALESELGELEHELIARDPFVLAAPPGHPLARHTTPLPAKELRECAVLLLDEGHCLRDQTLELCAAAKAPELEFRATSLLTLVQMVAGGAGVTLLPSLAVPTETRRAALKIRPLAAPSPGRTLALCWRKQSPLGEALVKVAGVIRETVQATLLGSRKR